MSMFKPSARAYEAALKLAFKLPIWFILSFAAALGSVIGGEAAAHQTLQWATAVGGACLLTVGLIGPLTLWCAWVILLHERTLKTIRS